ncbi:E3 ubiquitin-protein ligase WAV3-like [Andrographis paniculata]|uniref:E3 ubiquitin-protein ligase WAV3-like n=1 Tax=Andrographis paniculata TaxID=175694 RepID=UPI0021E95AF5|nr:E3 ubiquitin-protein ligase WAV3-like [Andrographis paniculata]XP_051140792.1 E3 ubiquitin-protein ligase WAV3-like [Andrographis paniculata]
MNIDFPKIKINAVPEIKDVDSTTSRSRFQLLVKLNAPSMSNYARPRNRAPIDLVVVLDTSHGMRGSKFDEMKRGVVFLIENLWPDDRLSMVSLSPDPRKMFPLLKMTETRQQEVKRIVDSLVAGGSTNVAGGLLKAAEVLDERVHKNIYSCIIFLSGSRDNCYCTAQPRGVAEQSHLPDYLNALPPSIYPRKEEKNGELRRTIFPVYTFGIASYHDPRALRVIADASGGTYSFIDSFDLVQDALASCLGGILSLVAQNVNLIVDAASPGIKIQAINSGIYDHSITCNGCRGKIEIPDLYSDEEKYFLIYFTLPKLVIRGSESDRATYLAEIKCIYVDGVMKEHIMIEHARVDIHRPIYFNPMLESENFEIRRQMERLRVEETIAKTIHVAEAGNLQKAQEILSTCVLRFSRLKEMGNLDEVTLWLFGEMLEIEGRMKNQRMYEMKGGRAYALATLSLLGHQRATTRGDRVPGEEGTSESVSFELFSTTNMVKMVTKSRKVEEAL